jgi:hypothetical protein
MNFWSFVMPGQECQREVNRTSVLSISVHFLYRVCSMSMHSCRGCPVTVLQKHSLNHKHACLIACMPMIQSHHNYSFALTFQCFSIGSHCPLYQFNKIFFQTCLLNKNRNGARMLIISTSRQVAPYSLAA